jgi:hypothetical protein
MREGRIRMPVKKNPWRCRANRTAQAIKKLLGDKADGGDPKSFRQDAIMPV